MRWTEADIPDLTGRIAVVTGANGGLGLATAAALARRRAHVVMAVRDQAKAALAVDRIRSESPDAALELVPIDLGSLASVRDAAEQILAGHDRVDILINNAGLMAMPERVTTDGFELQLGVNHLGHWALTAQLMPAVLAAPQGRVVSVTSIARHPGRPIDPANPHLRGNYSPWGAYSQSKLANYHFGLGLQREFQRAGVRAQSLLAHPGGSNTDLMARSTRERGAGSFGPLWERIAARASMGAADGALPQLRAATDPGARGGELHGPRYASIGHPVRLPVLRPGAERAIAILWEVSERETGIPMRIS